MTDFEKMIYEASEFACNNFHKTYSDEAVQTWRDICYGITAFNKVNIISDDFYDKWCEDFGSAWEELADY